MQRSTRIIILSGILGFVLSTLLFRLCVGATPTLILSYPATTSVSGCGLVYTTSKQYQWPCVIFRNGVDPK